MYKGTVSNITSYTAGTNIPFTTVLNTNRNTTPDTINNKVVINKPGYYDVNCMLNVTTNATTTTAQIYADGAAVPEAIASETTTAGDTVTLNLTDVLKIALAAYPSAADIEVRIASATTAINSGLLIIEERR